LESTRVLILHLPSRGSLSTRCILQATTSIVSYGAKAAFKMPFSSIKRPAQHECRTCDLRTLRMFCNLDGDALADFETIGVQATLSRGAKLFQEDAPSNGVFVICTGQVKLFSTSREGRTLILKIAMPGDVLGLGAVISGSPYEVTAEVIEPTEIKSIRQEEFLSFIQKHGEASLHAAKSLSEEYKAAFFDARRLALSGSAAGRLASVLLDWGRASSCGKPEMRFTMALTHEELASLVGSSRETITRMLGRFKRDKLIQIRGASILILSPEKLEQFSA
jgi:CRP/FNR family transcriptional regulator, cyclic AMP receptor protein